MRICRELGAGVHAYMLGAGGWERMRICRELEGGIACVYVGSWRAGLHAYMSGAGWQGWERSNSGERLHENGIRLQGLTSNSFQNLSHAGLVDFFSITGLGFKPKHCLGLIGHHLCAVSIAVPHRFDDLLMHRSALSVLPQQSSSSSSIGRAKEARSSTQDSSIH